MAPNKQTNPLSAERRVPGATHLLINQGLQDIENLRGFTTHVGFESKFGITRWGREARMRRIRTLLLQFGHYDVSFNSASVQKDIIPAFLADDYEFELKYKLVADQSWALIALTWLIWRVWDAERLQRARAQRRLETKISSTTPTSSVQYPNMKAESAMEAKEVNDTDEIQAASNVAERSTSRSRSMEDDWGEEDFKLEIRKIELQQRLRKLQKEKHDTEQV